MIPTAGEWRELVELLRPGSFRPRNFDGFESMPAKDAADVIGAVHLEDMTRRVEAAQHNTTWKWMQAHHGYRAFLSSVQKQIERSVPNCSGESKTFDAQSWLAARYMEQMDRGRESIRLSAHYDSLRIRRDRAIAEALAGALGSDDWTARHKALCHALKHVRKAREAVAFMLPTNDDAELEELAWQIDEVALRDDSGRLFEIMARRQAREAHSLIAFTGRLEREEGRLRSEIQSAAAMKTLNGQIRWFLVSIFGQLRTCNCGTTTGLRRLVEMLDPESSVSDDTIRRIRTEAVKREARATADFAAWQAKEETRQEVRMTR